MTFHSQSVAQNCLRDRQTDAPYHFLLNVRWYIKQTFVFKSLNIVKNQILHFFIADSFAADPVIKQAISGWSPLMPSLAPILQIGLIFGAVACIKPS